jgi:hypothetical protein
MTIIHENGTATVTEAFAKAVAEATHGHVTFSAASMLTGTVWAGGFTDRAVGNSRGKAWLEALFNPMHNRLADLPGQTGRRYDVAPASDHGRRKELAALVKAGLRLRVEQRAELRMPYLSLDEARDEIHEAFDALNLRTDHDLEGFRDVLEWRWQEGEPWRVWEATPPPAGAEGEVLSHKRKESPFERYKSLSEEAGTKFGRLAAHSVPSLLCQQREVKLERGEVAFDADKTRYRFTPYTPENIPTLQALARLGEGKPVLAYYAASDLETIYLTDGAGRWIGELWRTDKHGRGADAAEKTKVRIATKKALLSDTIARVNARSPEVAEEREAVIAHNLDVLAHAEAHPVIAPGDDDGSGTTAAPEAHTRIAEAAVAKAKAERTTAAETKAKQKLSAKASAAFASLGATVGIPRPEDAAGD